MSDLLLELRSEEIPARMQRKAAGDLKKFVTNGLVDAGLTYEAAREYWTPRRLVLDIRGLTIRSKDVHEERKGPSVKASEQAIAGFLRSAGLSDISQAYIHNDPNKGDFYVARTIKAGRSAEEIIAELVPQVIYTFSWPKSMRWGEISVTPSAFRWIRPLQSIVCTFGPETEEPIIIDFVVDGIHSSNITYGHRFMSDGMPIVVRRFEDYATKLEKAKVILDAERRKDMICTDARNLAFASRLDLVEDEDLLEEVCGLVEWPVVLMGTFEKEFLEIPPEVIKLTIRAHQKCFVTRSQQTHHTTAPFDKRDRWSQGMEGAMSIARLSHHFILISNIEAKDGGREIVYGNSKVVRARLSDALYFWKTDQLDLPDLDKLKTCAAKFDLDLAKPLDQRMARLDALHVTFHAKLGTQGERVERIRRLAEEIAPCVGADSALTARAALLSKADLQTEMVGEFPELQGIMGRQYATLQGEHPSIAAAIEEHYKPQGPSDIVPNDPVSVAVALADKLDTLVGFWMINDKPTGSKDPFALRRAALGVIRILLSKEWTFSLMFFLHSAMARFNEKNIQKLLSQYEAKQAAHNSGDVDGEEDVSNAIGGYEQRIRCDAKEKAQPVLNDLLSFFHDRLKSYLREQDVRHDVLDAVLAGGTFPPFQEKNETQNDDLLSIVRRVEALIILINTEDGKNLLISTKRAVNILSAEEKKGTIIAENVDPFLLHEAEEKMLHRAVTHAQKDANEALQKKDFSAAMLVLARLRQPIDAFFEKVLVNSDNEAIRANRLALLTHIRHATYAVADFSKILS